MTENHASDVLRTLPDRISEVIKPWVAQSPDRLALVESAGTWTYRQLSFAVDEARAWLLNAGVRPGDRVMIVCENCRALVAILLASASLDAWPVLVHARLSAREVDEIREHCGARRVIYTTSGSLPAAEHAKRHGAAIEELDGLGIIGFGGLSESAEQEAIEPNVADRVAALIYTSGTTGLPKGVMLSHRNLLFLAAGSARI